ncbi:hypothetical protein E2562_024555 [Oryza meyeriana var. granulata]|uniref:F-box domain-containing protein n=1 Tax=Oryza meyeriana var. granulata TaxID=110450 RepID=A0A6G1BNI7_9ORYZ|nr:hypothetical protein E2562_024555 [Oryza meyeriana var. granulata]
MDTPAADWSDLPADVLGLVLLKLEFPDLFRSAAVCTSWRATARDIRRLGLYTRAQTPCLLYTTAAAGPRAAVIYSLADKATYTVRLPDPPIAERYIIGSSHGWLVTADDRSELHLLNPATGEQLALPSVTTVEHVRPLYDGAGNLHKYEVLFFDGNLRSNDEDLDAVTHPPETFREFFYLKAVISGDPSRGDYAVMLIHHPHYQLSFARSGDKKWTWVKFENNVLFRDCIYHDGVFYAQTLYAAIHAIDVSGPASSSFTHRLICKPCIHACYNVYIVRTPEGEILHLVRLTEVDNDREDQELRTAYVGACKMDLEKQCIKEVDDLGGNALFIGKNYSTCLSVKDYPQLMPNHIYFDDDDECWLYRKQLRRDVGVYDYENNSRLKTFVGNQLQN